MSIPKKQFKVTVNDAILGELPITCWGYDKEDAVNGCRVEWIHYGGGKFPPVISVKQLPIIAKKSLFERLFGL